MFNGRGRHSVLRRYAAQVSGQRCHGDLPFILCTVKPECERGPLPSRLQRGAARPSSTRGRDQSNLCSSNIRPLLRGGVDSTPRKSNRPERFSTWCRPPYAREPERVPCKQSTAALTTRGNHLLTEKRPKPPREDVDTYRFQTWRCTESSSPFSMSTKTDVVRRPARQQLHVE